MQCVQAEPVSRIEPQCRIVRPRDDMAGPQHGLAGDAGDAALPIMRGDDRRAKERLASPLRRLTQKFRRPGRCRLRRRPLPFRSLHRYRWLDDNGVVGEHIPPAVELRPDGAVSRRRIPHTANAPASQVRVKTGKVHKFEGHSGWCPLNNVRQSNHRRVARVHLPERELAIECQSLQELISCPRSALHHVKGNTPEAHSRRSGLPSLAPEGPWHVATGGAQPSPSWAERNPWRLRCHLSPAPEGQRIHAVTSSLNRTRTSRRTPRRERGESATTPI